jgi:transcriptional regulator with XRE-family HTH domain
MEVIDRIKALIELKAKSERDFSLKIGVNQVTLNNYTMGKRKVSLELVELVLKAFPDVRAEWLIRGNGDMLEKEELEEVESYESNETFYKRIIDDQLDTISMLKKRLMEKESSDNNNNNTITA